MEHKAYLFDWGAFERELRAILEEALRSGDRTAVVRFITKHVAVLMDPYESEALGPDWERMLESQDVHQCGDIALTKYYDPAADLDGTGWRRVRSGEAIGGGAGGEVPGDRGGAKFSQERAGGVGGEIELCVEAFEAGKIGLTISGPEGEPNLRMPEDSVYEDMFALYELFLKEGKAFRVCRFRLARRHGGALEGFGYHEGTKRMLRNY